MFQRWRTPSRRRTILREFPGDRLRIKRLNNCVSPLANAVSEVKLIGGLVRVLAARVAPEATKFPMPGATPCRLEKGVHLRTRIIRLVARYRDPASRNRDVCQVIEVRAVNRYIT